VSAKKHGGERRIASADPFEPFSRAVVRLAYGQFAEWSSPLFCGCSGVVLSGSGRTCRVLRIPLPPRPGRRHHAEEELVKTTTKMKKITVRRTGDVRLTTATCKCPYSVEV
jgi:hypothetical protein